MTVPAVPHSPTVASRLADCVRTFGAWLSLPDPGSLCVTLATIVANRCPGDPLWLLLVGGPSTGKTEPVRACAPQPDCRLVGYVTEAGLLSGVSKKKQADDAQGGLLREIGDFGILLLKDFTSILSMQRDTRASLLAALREVADGSWTRTVGTDGGRTLHWQGKLGVLGCVTGAIDSAHGVMGLMGERFVLYRMPEQSAAAQGRAALNRRGSATRMRQELAGAVDGVLQSVTIPTELPSLEPSETDWLVAVAEFVVRARSAIERDGYSREITLIPEAEAPARLALALRQLLAGLYLVGVERPAAYEIVRKVGMDSVPQIRRRVLEKLAEEGGLGTRELAERLGYPTGTTRRALEDVTAHSLALRDGEGGGSKGDQWRLTPDAERLWQGMTVPEMSEPPSTPTPFNSSLLYERDISGKDSHERPAVPRGATGNGREEPPELVLLAELRDLRNGMPDLSRQTILDRYPGREAAVGAALNQLDGKGKA